MAEVAYRSGELWRVMPDTHARVLSRGKWILYRYLRYVVDLVFKAIIQGDGRIIFSIPPRHGKSEFCSHRLPVYFLDNWPGKNVILATYESDFAAKWGRQVRNTIQGEPGRLQVRVSSDSHSASRWNTTQGGGMLSTGIGGPVTGFGGHLILVDDPHKNWKEAQSPTRRQEVIDWFKSTLYTRCEPGATIIVIQTRWHENDLAGYLLSEHEDPWVEIRLPAIAEDDCPLGRKRGEALCPERYDRLKLQKIENALGSVMWNALYQQRPVAEGGSIFKRPWFMYYRMGTAPEGLVIQSWDTAFEDKEGVAYSVCTTWVRGALGYYLLNVWRERVEYPELKRAILAQAAKFRPKAILIEYAASGKPAVQELKRDTRLPIIGQSVNDQGKYVRAQSVSPVVESGRAFLPEGAPWIGDYLDEMVRFPSGTYADQVDSTTQALAYFQALEGSIISGGKVIGGAPK